MGKKSQEVSDYISDADKWAQPILKRIRKLFHQACPEISETMKWGAPHFELQGIVAGMAAFKTHVKLGFWKSKLMDDPANLFVGLSSGSMTNVKVESLDDLPGDDVLMAYIAQACSLNASGKKLPRRDRKPKPMPPIPEGFRGALDRSKAAGRFFNTLSPSHQREYIEWIAEAKREQTATRRIEQAIEWLAEGKSRNWKYERKK